MKSAAIIVGAGVVVAGAGAVAATRGKVHFIEHAAGVHPALRALLGEWNRNGSHEISVAPADTNWPTPGGVRTDAEQQAADYRAGLTRASTLDQTAHGRAAAIDVWPKGFNPRRGFDSQPTMEHLFRVFGEWAERQVVVLDEVEYRFNWLDEITDLPHVEIIGWRALPYPPPDYGRGFV